MKYEDDDIMIDIPKNVMTKRWFPQRDILRNNLCNKYIRMYVYTQFN